jgi:hypothetical protein
VAGSSPVASTQIPTVVIDGLSEAKRRALMIADNRRAETAEWNEQLLAEQLKDLSLAELWRDSEGSIPDWFCYGEKTAGRSATTSTRTKGRVANRSLARPRPPP